MQILFLSQVLPYPLDAGPKMRSYFVLRHLAQDHRVTLLTFIRDTDRPEDIAHLASFCEAVHTVPIRRSRLQDARHFLQSLITKEPFLIVRDHIPAMAAKLQILLQTEEFDAIHADQLWMAQYALAAKSTSSKPRLVLDQHNAVHLIPQRMAGDMTNPIARQVLRREANLLARYEPDICRQFDNVVWVTEEDRRAVASLSQAPAANGDPGLDATVIPICGDPTQTDPITQKSDKRRITFLGGLHWPPNAQGVVWFAEQVFPLVRKEIPDATLMVIGKSPPGQLGGDGIEVTGYVPDLEPYLAETAVFIVPLHAGGGMRVKILDAWGWGLPIVSTTIGAEGINIQPGQDILIADTVQDFAQKVVNVLRDQELAHQLSVCGRQTAIEKYNWRTVYESWNDIYPPLNNGHSH